MEGRLDAGELTTVSLHELSGDGKTESRTAIPPRDEGLEELLDTVSGNPGTVVGHEQDYPLP